MAGPKTASPSRRRGSRPGSLLGSTPLRGSRAHRRASLRTRRRRPRPWSGRARRRAGWPPRPRVASMPLTSGMCRSMSTTSGWRSSVSSTASLPVEASPTTLASSTEASSARSPSRKRVVVRHEDAESGAHAEARGSRARTLVPFPSRASTSHVPPSSCLLAHRGDTDARAVVVGRPALSSTTSSSRSSLSAIRTTQVRASACRAAFVIASSEMRYAATSTAAGRPSSWSDASISTRGWSAAPSFSACSRSASTSPSSSSAGGRARTRAGARRRPRSGSPSVRPRAACRRRPGPRRAGSRPPPP